LLTSPALLDAAGSPSRAPWREVLSTRVRLVTADTIIEGARIGTNSVPIVWRSLKLNAPNALARFKPILCDQCSQRVRAWHRRVWVANGERCAHLQCWNGLLFVNGYARLMAEEIRRRSRRYNQSSDNDHANPELRELRESAQALRVRAERLEAQLQQAGQHTAKSRI
jgi:hypothetical protein